MCFLSCAVLASAPIILAIITTICIRTLNEAGLLSYYCHIALDSCITSYWANMQYEGHLRMKSCRLIVCSTTQLLVGSRITRIRH